MKGDVVNLIAVPFLIGSVPFALSVIIGNRFLKSYRESNKFVFWGGITASAFAGWTVSNMIMARYTESELFGAERECNVCDSDSQSFCGKCRNHKGSCCRCVGSSDWEEMQREFPEVPYDAESFDADWQTNDKFWKMLHEEHDYLFDENGMVTIPHKQLSEIAKEMGFDTESFNAFSIDKDDEGKIHIENKCDGCGKEFLLQTSSYIRDNERAGVMVYENLGNGETHEPTYSPYGDLLCKSCYKEDAEEDDFQRYNRGQGQLTYDAEGNMIKVSATLYPGFWEDICNGDESINDVDWDIESVKNAESKNDDLTKVKEYTNRIMEQDPTVMAEFGRFGLFKLLEHPTAGDLSPLLFYTPLMGGLLMRTPLSHVNEMNDELAEKLSKTMVKQIKQGTYFEDDDWADFLYDAESFSADSKRILMPVFKEPYMKGGKLDMKRGNDGKFRRRLVVPLEKNQ